MLRSRPFSRPFSWAFAWVATLALAAAAASAAIAVDSVAPLNGTALGEVLPGGRPSAIGVLVPAGTSKGSITVKAAKGSLLVPAVALVLPDGTTQSAETLASLGAIVKATPKSISIKNLPAFPATGLYKVIVTGLPGGDGKLSAGGFSMKLAGKAPAGLAATTGNIATVNEKDDYILDVPEIAGLTVSLKPSKATPFAVSLKILAASGDEIDYLPFAKIGVDDSIAIKNLPLPAFGRYTLRVGTKVAFGDYTLSAKVKAGKKPVIVAGVPFADAGGPYFIEPLTKGTLDASGTAGATSYLWIPVSGPSLTFNNKVPNPQVTIPAARATYAWQLVARNSTGASLPSLAILEVDRAPVADAGPGAAVTGGSVQLDGSASTDLDAGETLFYSWEQVSGPAATLDDPYAAKPNFTPTAAGTYVFALEVNDGVLSSDRSLAVVSMGASGFVADAGRTIIVRPQETVFLSGLRSRKAGGAPPTQWEWSALGSNPVPVTLAGANGPVASFTAPKQPARLAFRLAVEGSATGADEVTVIVSNGASVNGTPVANAGGPLQPAASAGFSLVGTASADDVLVKSYEWMQVEGADAALQSASTATATATAPAAPGVLRFLLMVHDGRKYGAPDSAMVAVGAPAAPVASAGPDRSGTILSVLTLTSAASTPAPGQTIQSWQWTQLSSKDWYDAVAKDVGFDPTSPNPQLTVPNSVSSLSPTRTLLFGLTVTDTSGTSRQDLVTVVFANLPKNASPVISSATTTGVIFRPGATVALSAVATDPDGDPLVYTWSQVSGFAATISGSTLANATVTAPVTSGTLVYRVSVNDNTGEFNAATSADVSFSVNRAPNVIVSSNPASGPDGTLVTLNGSTTTDPDDASLAYAWVEIPPVSGANVTLSGETTSTASFTMPAYTGSVGARRRTFRLTVTDSMGAAFAVAQTVNFNPNKGPSAPGVTAMGDRKVYYADSASSISDKSELLTVTATTDPDGDPLNFSWTVESGPITSTSVLLSATSGSSITFKSAPRPTASQLNTGGVYVIGVTSTDGVEQSTKTLIDLVVMPSWSSDIYPIISSSCGIGTTGCHSATAPGGGLVLAGGAATARSNCLSRISTNNFQGSLLWVKIDNGSMPQGAGKLAQQTINLFRDWIEPEYNANPKPGLTTGGENN